MRDSVQVMEPPWLQPPEPGRLTGQEPIDGAGVSVADFWAWSLSDLRTNTVRSLLAEFLVAHAVGAVTRPRVEWDSFDVLMPNGDRLEVKAGAYLQAWEQPRLSAVTFSGLSSRTWSPRDGYSAERTYNAQAYVFAVVTATDHASYDPLRVDQWSFWVLPRDVLAATGQRSIRLSRVRTLAGPAVTFAALAARVQEVLARRPDPSP